jgi:hypothetical protein
MDLFTHKEYTETSILF